MTRTPATLLALATLALACGGPPAQAPVRPSVNGPDDAGADALTAPNTVSVEPGMLRDLRITTTLVESRSGGEEISLLGELDVDPRRYAEVGVPLPARVMRLLVEAGERVGPGQVLAELSSPELGRARAEYLSADARVRLAEAALERKRELAGERIVPLREVQEAESAAAEAHAALRSVRAAIVAFGVDPPADDGPEAISSTFPLRSPVAGSVIERSALVGRMVDPSTAAFRIADLSTLWLVVHAFERDAVRIAHGVTARVAFPALPGRTFAGVVGMIGRHVDRESRTVPVRIDVRNTGEVLRPGMSATAMVPIGAPDASILTVPVAAVQRVRGDWSVFVPIDDRTFEIRKIGRGRDLGGEVEVLSGLGAGDRIVVDGAFLLKAHAERAEADHDAH